MLNGIGCFRVNSQILPLKTHPDAGYELVELPGGRQIMTQFRKCGAFAKKAGVRTTFHPDQFVVLNSPRPDIPGPISLSSRLRDLSTSQGSPNGLVPMS